MEAQRKPMRPSSREALDNFVSYVMALTRIVKTDPEFFAEMEQYISAETARLGEVVAKAKKNQAPEMLQEALNLNRRLSIMSLFLKFLR